MKEQQRRQRAAFIREQPGLWLFLLYAVCFVGCAAASDVWQWASGVVVSRGERYLLPAVIALSMWRMLRRMALRVEPAPPIPALPMESWTDRVLPSTQFKAASSLTAGPAERSAAADRPRDTR
jgi:hypothetical protein